MQPDYFVAIVTVPDAQYRAVKPQIYPVPGLVFRSSNQRVAATPQLAAHVVGSTGPITKEILDQLGPPYDATSRVGRSGLERAYERRLAGTPSLTIQLVAGDGAVKDALQSFPGTAPAAVRTTLDLGTQQRAEAALGATAPAALVAVRPSDGAVRAVVSTPVTEEFDRALDGSYPPGSTFKVVTGAALLRNGVTLDTQATCPATITVNGRAFRNFEGETEPTLPFLRAFAISCNTAFIGLAQQLPDDALGAAATSFGFGTAAAPRAPYATRLVPAPGDATERAAAAIGQAKVTASPVVMAEVAGRSRPGSGTHRPWCSIPTTPTDTTIGPLEPTVVDALRRAMRQVVATGTGTSGGSPGRRSRASRTEFGNDTPPKTHAWFIGFRDNLAFAVVVEGGGVARRHAIAH